MRELKYVENNTYTDKIFEKPFQIHVDVNVEYFPEEEEEEYEVDITREEEEEPLTVIKSFRGEKCVVCLSKEPKVLFYDCKHYCVCLECEEMKPLKSCPCCRTRISTKMI